MSGDAPPPTTHHPVVGVLVWIAGVVAAFAFAYFLVEQTELFGESPGDVIRHAGAFLQFAGLALVAHGISDLRSRFGGPASGLSRLRAMIVRAWRRTFRRGRHQVVEIVGVSASGSGSSSVLAKGYRTPTNVEERVAILERQLQDERRRIDEVVERIRVESEARAAAEERESRARADADQRLEQTLRDLAIGGLFFESIGLYWLAVGIAFDSWPEELAILLHITIP
jgi:hypothetical protein